MSELHTTRNRNPEDDKPFVAAEEETAVDSFSPEGAKKGRRGFKIAVASGTLAVVLAGGGYLLGNRGGGDDVEAKAPPVATAPADPTEQPSTAPTGEAEPTTGATELNPETFSLLVNGERYNGVEDFRRKNELRVENYVKPDGSEDGGKLIHDLMSKVANRWIKSASDKRTAADFPNYTSKDGSATGPQGLAADIYDPAFAATYVAPGSDFPETMASAHQQYLKMVEMTASDPTPYDGEYVGTITTFYPSGTGDDLPADIKWGYQDNNAATEDGTPQSVRVTFTIVAGVDGDPTYVVKSFEVN